MNDFWKNGYRFGAGIREPYIFYPNHLSLWVNIDYSYFPFNHKANFPIKFSDGSQIPFNSGKDTHVFTGLLRLLISTEDNSKDIVLYFSLGSGMLKRSRTEFTTEYLPLSHVNTNYRIAGVFTFGLGFNARIKKEFRGFLDISYLRANTRPGITSYFPISLGVQF